MMVLPTTWWSTGPRSKIVRSVQTAWADTLILRAIALAAARQVEIRTMNSKDESFWAIAFYVIVVGLLIAGRMRLFGC